MCTKGLDVAISSVSIDLHDGEKMDSTNQWIGSGCHYVLFITHESLLQLRFYLHGIFRMRTNLQQIGGQPLVSILQRSTVSEAKWLCIWGKMTTQYCHRVGCRYAGLLSRALPYSKALVYTYPNY